MIVECVNLVSLNNVRDCYNKSDACSRTINDINYNDNYVLLCYVAVQFACSYTTIKCLLDLFKFMIRST